VSLIHRYATLGRAADGASRCARGSAKLNSTLRTLSVPSVLMAHGGIKLLRLPLAAVVQHPGSRQVGNCMECGAPVSEGDPFLRYRGDYYHAHGCLERNPPGLNRYLTPTRQEHRL
jgi:hypothetical protein